MNKRFILLIICIFVFCITNCVVNDNTGLIKIYNKTNSAISDLRVNDKVLISYLVKDGKFDYWFFSGFKGNMYCSIAESIHKYTFETGNEYELIIEKDNEDLNDYIIYIKD